MHVNLNNSKENVTSSGVCLLLEKGHNLKPDLQGSKQSLRCFIDNIHSLQKVSACIQLDLSFSIVFYWQWKMHQYFIERKQ